ncbi:MAG: AAA family ATPase [Chlamydiota bacterium]
MNHHEQRFFVLTGGPGSGKSAIIEALHRAGYAGSVEAGRGIIQDQVAIGGRALPWHDPVLFSELMLSWDLRSYRMAEQAAGPVFFDRGVVDVVGYLRLLDRPLPEHVQRAVETFRYNRRVFIAPPWQEIYRQDGERKQDFAEAVRTYQAMVAAYSQNGYELIEIPLGSVEERTRFVLDAIRNGPGAWT